MDMSRRWMTVANLLARPNHRTASITLGLALLAAAASLLCATPSRAALISVDFDQTTAVATQAGFTSIAGPVSNATTLSQVVGGFTVSADFTSTSAFSGAFNRGGVTNGGALTYADLYNDFLYTNLASSAGIILSIAGVTPNTPYTFTLYSFDPSMSTATSITTTFAAGANTSGASGTVTYTSVTPTYTSVVPTTNNQYSTTLTFTSTTSTINIFATATNNAPGISADYLRINGFTMDAVPEPASLALFSLAGLTLVRRRRGC